jgi:hypothetical protein
MSVFDMARRKGDPATFAIARAAIASAKQGGRRQGAVGKIFNQMLNDAVEKAGYGDPCLRRRRLALTLRVTTHGGRS